VKRLLSHASVALAAFLLAWWIWHPRPAFEPPAPAKELPGGGLVLERAIVTPPADVREAAREAGGKLERAVRVIVRPRSVPAPAPVASETATPHTPEVAVPVAAASAPGCQCAPVTVELGLVRMPDRTRRVVATSPDGEILGGLDIPVDMPALARKPRWAAGMTYEPRLREFGAFVDRDIGPLRLGVALQNRREGAAVVLRAGIRF
jgi:hypothetical protein